MVVVKEKLKSLMKSRALRTGVEIKLASGQMSNYYINCKEVTLHGPSLKVLSEVFVSELQKISPRPSFVAGVSVGGDPLVAGVIQAAADQGWELEGLLVRKEAKNHGMSAGKAVEGAAPRAGQGVYLLEDVVSTGGSLISAAQYLTKEGYELRGVLCIVDRQMGGAEKIEAALNLKLHSIFKVEELL